jgi:hypothetical protein
MEVIVAVVEEPFILAGVVHVLPLELVAYSGALTESNPVATNRPELLTVIAFIRAYELLPFMSPGLFQEDPLVEVE